MEKILQEHEFLKTKDTVLAEALTGSRVYSTDLHPHNFADLDSEQFDEELIRADISLKAKIITRGLVTINGAHFLSPMGMRFIDAKGDDFLKNPALRTAYRIDENSGFDAYRKEYQNASIDLYRDYAVNDASIVAHARSLDETLNNILPWDPDGVGDRYRNLVEEGLNDETSIVRTFLRSGGFDESHIGQIAESLKGQDLSDDNGMNLFLLGQPPELRQILRPYLLSCYHLIGVGVVNCEAGTDLMPMASLRAHEAMSGAGKILHDELGDFKAYFKAALEVTGADYVPEAFLESLSYAEAAEVGQRLHKTRFAECYENVLAAYSKGLKFPNSEEGFNAIDLGHVNADILEMESLFNKEIGREYQELLEEKAKGKLVRATRDMVVNFASLVNPFVSAVTSLVGIFSARQDAKAQVDEIIKKDVDAKRNQLEILRDKRIKKLIENAKISDENSLRDGANMLIDLASAKARRLI